MSVRYRRSELHPRLGGSPGGECGNPLQHSCQENPMDRGVWWALVHEVAKSPKWLKKPSRHSLNRHKFDQTGRQWKQKGLCTAVHEVVKSWIPLNNWTATIVVTIHVVSTSHYNYFFLLPSLYSLWLHQASFLIMILYLVRWPTILFSRIWVFSGPAWIGLYLFSVDLNHIA